VNEIERFASDPEQLHAVLGRLANLVDTARDLPESVFQTEGGEYAFCDFGRVFRREFASVLTQLTRVAGDEYVQLVSLPEPRDYLLPSGSSFGALKIPTAELAASYWPAVALWPEAGSGKALMYSAVRVVLFGSQGGWTIWADRFWEIAIVRTDFSDSSWRDGMDYFFDISSAQNVYTEFAQRPEFESPGFWNAFTQNYSKRR